MDMATPRLWKRQDTTEGSLYLKEILRLHNLGWPSNKIGRKFGKDHSTILYHLRKLGVAPRGRGYYPPAPLQNIVVSLGNYNKYDYLFNEPVNQGKTYKEYLKASGKSKADIKRLLAIKTKGGAQEDMVNPSSVFRSSDF